jgi:preprotein translocase subunit SecE
VNPRNRQLTQKILAITFFVVGFVIIILAFPSTQAMFGYVQLPDWWLNLIDTYHSSFPWWPVVNGLLPETHYSARIYLTVAMGLVIFLPQVETTFVSLMRRRSPIGTPYVDRTHFTCPVCGTVNRPSVQFCVKCGSQISGDTRYWEKLGAGRDSVSTLKWILWVASLFAFFIGLFDLTIYSAMTNYLGTDPTVVLLATLISVVPSIAGYVALKEGPYRKYASLKQFDKLVFGNQVWILFGLFFLLLGLGGLLVGIASPAATLLLTMQLVLGVSLVSYPTLRKRMAGLGPHTIPFDNSRVW